MSKPDPSITANLLSQLPTRTSEAHAAAHVPSMHKEHNLLPKSVRTNAKSVEKSSVQGHTRSSNRGK